MAFEGDLDVDNIITGLSTIIPDVDFDQDDTCLILDEIQECPQARTALKFFHTDGRFDVIGLPDKIGCIRAASAIAPAALECYA